MAGKPTDDSRNDDEPPKKRSQNLVGKAALLGEVSAITQLARIGKNPLAGIMAGHAAERARIATLIGEASAAMQLARIGKTPLSAITAGHAAERARIATLIGEASATARLAGLGSSPLAARIAELDHANVKRFGEAVQPQIEDLAVSMGTVLATLPTELVDRVDNVSAEVVGRVVSGSHSETVDHMASELVESSDYEEIWEVVQDEVDALLTDSVATQQRTSAREAAAWHITWLLAAVKASLPATADVEKISKAVSVSAVAFVFCAVLRPGYPALWKELQELQLTPFDLAGYVFAVLAWVAVHNGKDE